MQDQELGKPREPDTIKIEGSNLTMKGILPPEGCWLADNPQETIIKNIWSYLIKKPEGVEV